MSRPINVLHVDDSAALRDLTAEFLEKVTTDISVQSVADPTDVLPRVDSGDIDCIVADYEMPGQNGLDLCLEVREAYPDLPFFLFTSRGGEEIISRAMVAGATDYIQKEPGLEQYTLLANRITNAVSRHRAEARIAELECAVHEGTATDGGTGHDDGPAELEVEVVSEPDADTVGGSF